MLLYRVAATLAVMAGLAVLLKIIGKMIERRKPRIPGDAGAYGLVASTTAIGSGIITCKVAYYLIGGRFNPLVGACGVSAFPMAARTDHGLGRKEADNQLLPAAVATSTGGQVGSVVTTGVVLSPISRQVST